MIMQNVKMAIKSAIKQKRITVLNTLGLALGLACAIIIYLWVDDELSYEKNYKNADQIHLAYLKVTSGNDVSYQPVTSLGRKSFKRESRAIDKEHNYESRDILPRVRLNRMSREAK